VLPERPLFSRDAPEPSASIVLRVRGALELQQVRAIRHLVASAVNGLKPQRVSIVDEAGQLLADGAADGANNGATGDERRVAFEKRLRGEIESIVSSVVGAGRARVQLSADFDYNKVTQTSDTFDPEGRVLRSSQTREESSVSADNRDGQVTVNNELPGNQRQDAAATARDQSKKSEETNNYEISRTTKTEVTEAGRVNRISRRGAGGRQLRQERQGANWSIRPRQGTARPHRRAGALGDRLRPEARRSGRGGQPQVRRAAPALPINEPAGMLGMLSFTKDDVMNLIEMVVVLLLGLVVVFMVVRPLVKRILSPDPAAARLSRPRTGAGRCHAAASRSKPRARQQRRLADDRRRPGSGPGSRAIGPSGR